MDFFRSITEDQPFFKVVFPGDRTKPITEEVSIRQPKSTPKSRRPESNFIRKYEPRRTETSSKPIPSQRMPSQRMPSQRVPESLPPTTRPVRQTNQEFLDSLQHSHGVRLVQASEALPVATNTAVPTLSPIPVELVQPSLDAVPPSTTTVNVDDEKSNIDSHDEIRNFLDLVYKGMSGCVFRPNA
jgi:hypothetical protein